MATAKKRGDSWRCNIFIGMDNGKRVYKSFTASTKREAEAMATKYAKEHKSVSKTSKLTFTECANCHISINNNIWSVATVRKYKDIVKTITKKYEWFAIKKVDFITERDVNQLINEMIVDFAPKTVKTNIGFVKSCLKNVTDLKGAKTPRIEPTEVEIPTDEEFKKLLSAVKGTCMEIPTMLGGMAMMRRGEICALTMEDINFDECTIRINKDMVMDENSKWVVKPPKTVYSNRTIPVRKEILDAIKKQGYITHCNPNKLTGYFTKYCKKADIPIYNFHATRHYCVSVFSLSAPIHYIKFYGGWGDTRTIEKIYQHVMRDKTNEIFNNALAHFDNFEICNQDATILK